MEPLILLGILFTLIFLRMPVPFALLGAAVGFILVQIVTGSVPIIAIAGLKVIPQRITPSLESFPLLAIPLFVFAGNLLNHTGITDRIFTFAKSLVAHIHGGLAHVNILASIVFSGMSGVATSEASQEVSDSLGGGKLSGAFKPISTELPSIGPQPAQ